MSSNKPFITQNKSFRNVMKMLIKFARTSKKKDNKEQLHGKILSYRRSIESKHDIIF